MSFEQSPCCKLVSGHSDGTVMIWRRTSENQYELNQTLKGIHLDWINCLLELSGDLRNEIVSHSLDKKMNSFSYDPLKEAFELERACELKNEIKAMIDLSNKERTLIACSYSDINLVEIWSPFDDDDDEDKEEIGDERIFDFKESGQNFFYTEK